MSVVYDKEGNQVTQEAFDRLQSVRLTNDELVKAIDWVHYRLKDTPHGAQWYPYLERHLSALLDIQAKRAAVSESDGLREIHRLHDAFRQV